MFVMGPAAGIGMPMPGIVPGIPAVMGLIIVLIMIAVSFVLLAPRVVRARRPTFADAVTIR
jgi:hypothetical protein